MDKTTNSDSSSSGVVVSIISMLKIIYFTISNDEGRCN